MIKRLAIAIGVLMVFLAGVALGDDGIGKEDLAKKEQIIEAADYKLTKAQDENKDLREKISGLETDLNSLEETTKEYTSLTDDEKKTVDEKIVEVKKETQEKKEAEEKAKKEEEERKKAEEEAKKAAEEQAKKEQEEAERLAKEEAERIAQEEAERAAQEQQEYVVYNSNESAQQEVQETYEVQEVYEAPVSEMVWISATGSKYHSISNCGSMNPDKANQITLDNALARGMQPCSKCH